MSVDDDKLVVESLIANDPDVIEDFFFNRCHAALDYIIRFFCLPDETPESLIGEFYEYLSSGDWHKLRIFRYSCSLNAYVTVIATRYFQHKRDVRIRLYADEDALTVQQSVQPHDTFTIADIERLVSQMKPLDRLLIERILMDGEKPSDILDEVKPLLREEHLEAMDAKQLAGYVYTRYSRARRRLQNQLTALGYRL